MARTGGEAARRLAELQRENEDLRAELEALRRSTSFRMGHAMVRAANLVRPGRRRGGSPGSPTAAEGPATTSVAAADADAYAPLRRSEPHPPYPVPDERARVRRGPLVRYEAPSTPRAEVPDGPVFVGGTGRSGTWVIGRMLGAHDAWTTLHTELRFHAVPSGYRMVLSGERSPEEFAQKVSRRWHRVTGGSGLAKGLQVLLTPHELSAALRVFRRRADDDLAGALGELLMDVVEYYVRGRGSLGWTETTPANAEAAEALLTTLPRAKLIHTVRDGRDVAASVTKMPWGPDTIEESLEWWAQRVLAAYEGTEPVADRVLTVRLEELVHLDRDAQFDRVVDFTGFADTTRIREYFQDKVDRERGHVGRWRGEVDAAQRDRIDGRYRELLAELADLDVACLPTDPDQVDDLAG